MSTTEIKEIKIKPCPFCGGKATVEEHRFNTFPSSYGIKCTRCEAQGFQFWESAYAAIVAWNMRVPEESE